MSKQVAARWTTIAKVALLISAVQVLWLLTLWGLDA